MYLLTILPSGVVSKKPIGAFKIRFNIALCINFDAFSVVRYTVILKHKVPMACANPNTP